MRDARKHSPSTPTSLSLNARHIHSSVTQARPAIEGRLGMNLAKKSQCRSQRMQPNAQKPARIRPVGPNLDGSRESRSGWRERRSREGGWGKYG
jgi:hypothetical protein